MRMPGIERFHNFVPNPRKFSQFGEKKASLAKFRLIQHHGRQKTSPNGKKQYLANV